MKFELKPVKYLPLKGIDITPILDAFIKQDSDVCELNTSHQLTLDNLKRRLQKLILKNVDYADIKVHCINKKVYLSRNVNTVAKVI